MKPRLAILAYIALMPYALNAQMKIGNNPTSINSASLLELESTNKGLVFPNVLLSDVASPAPLPAGLLAGTVVYNINGTITGGSGTGLYIWNGTVWMYISTGGISSTAWGLTGNSAINAANNFIGTINASDFVVKTNNTERLRILGTSVGLGQAGWIGVGTAMPRSVVDIVGSASNNNIFTIQNTSGAGYSSIDIRDAAGNLVGTLGYVNSGVVNQLAGKNYLSTYNNDFVIASNSSTYNLFIQGNSLGYIGINTGTPQQRLHVNGKFWLDSAFMPGGNAGTTGQVLISTGANTPPAWQTVSSSAWNLTGNANTDAALNFLGTIDNKPLAFKTNNTERMLLGETGNLGIGTSTPAYKLQVVAPSNPLYLGGVQATSSFTTDSVLTIFNGVVKKAPYSSIINSISATAPLTYNSATGALGINKATAFADGYLSSTDWNTFNRKIGSITLNTPSTIYANPVNFTVSAGAASGTLSLNTQTSNTVFAGPASGAAAQPIFRTLVAADIPSLAGSYIQNQTMQQAGANFNISGNGIIGTNLSVTGTSTFTGAVTSNAGSTNTGIFTSSGGIANINAGSNFATNINTGTSTANVTLGNSANNILLPKFSATGGLFFTSANTGQIGNTATDMTWDDLNDRLGIGITTPAYKLHILATSNPLYLGGVQETSNALSLDSVLLIKDGVVKKISTGGLGTGNQWLLTGNSGTNYSTNFLGTTDKVSFRLRTNNIQRILVDSLGSVALGSEAFDAYNREKLLVDYGTTASHTVANFKGTIDDYFQINVQNFSPGGNASSDYVATANDGTDSTFFVDLGINSSNFNVNADNWGGPHDAYIYSNSRNLIVGTQAPSSDVYFLIGGGSIKSNSVFKLNGPNGNVVVGKGDASASPVGNTIRGPGANGTNIAGGSLTVRGGAGSGPATGGSLGLFGGSSDTGPVGAVNINTGAAGATNINTGTSASNVTIGGTGNNIIIPKYSTIGGLYYTSLSTGQIGTTGTNMTWDSINTRLGIGITTPQYKLSVVSAANPLYLAGVQATSSFTTDSILTILNGVVKKSPYASLLASGWLLAGNANISPSTNFIGTTDAQPLVFRTNNAERMRMLSTGNIGIGTTNPSNALSIIATNPLYLSGLTAISSVSTSDSLLTITGGVVKKTPASIFAGGWLTTGNSGTNSATNFIGTTDQQGLTFKVNNVQAGFLGLSGSSYATAFGVGSSAVYQSTAIGSGAQATGSNASLAVGYLATAANQNSIAIGSSSATTADEVIAIGPRAKGGAYRGIAIGADAQVSGSTQNIAIGYNSNASSFNGIAIGLNAAATTNNNTLAIGVDAAATGFISLAIGNTAKAPGQNSSAFGAGAQANAAGANAFGNSAIASGVNSLAVGNSSFSGGVNSVTFGDNSTASGDYAIIIGNSAQATKTNATVVGYNSTASGIGSSVYGNNSTASGDNSIVMGDNSSATGTGTTIIANGVATAANNAVILGNSAKKVGIGTFAPAYKLHVLDASNPLYLGGVQDIGSFGTGDSILTINAGVVEKVSYLSLASNYIQNQTTQQPSSSFNISGNGVMGGNLSVSGTSTLTGAVTSNGGITNKGGFTTSAGNVNINNSGSQGTNINTGANTGNVTIGNANNNILLPGLQVGSVNDSVLVVNTSGVVRKQKALGNVSLSKYLTTISIPDIQNNSGVTVDVTVTGIPYVAGGPNPVIFINPEEDVAANLVVAWVRVAAANTIRISFRNVTNNVISARAVKIDIGVIQ